MRGEPLSRLRRAPLVADTAIRAVLLGTAGRQQPEVDAVRLLERGRGRATPRTSSTVARARTRQMWRAGIGLNPNFDRSRPQVKAIFLTHLHGDHIVDLPNFFMGSWPPNPVDVYGPAPAGLPIPRFPPDLVAPMIYPDEPTPGTRATARPHAPRVRLQREPQGARRRPQGRHAIGARARDRRASATASCPTSTSESAPTRRASRPRLPTWSRSSSTPRTSTA